MRLFHFAGGFDPRTGELGGARAPAWWPRVADRPGLARLCADYAARLVAAGHEPAAEPGSDGLDWAMRAAYRDGLIAAEAHAAEAPPNPFADGVAAFTAWLAAPRWEGSGVSRYIAAIRSARADLRAAFPAVPGADEAALLAWAASKDATDGLPTRALTA